MYPWAPSDVRLRPLRSTYDLAMRSRTSLRRTTGGGFGIRYVTLPGVNLRRSASSDRIRLSQLLEMAPQQTLLACRC